MTNLDNSFELEEVLLVGALLVGKLMIYVGTKKANDLCWDKDELIGHIKWLIDNIYVVCGDFMFRQVIGIHMGTDCASFWRTCFFLLMNIV